MRYNHFTMLPEQAFKPLGGKMTLEGGGSSAPAQPSTATQYNTNIPEYAKPYVTNMLGATQTQLFDMDADKGITGFKPYQPYSSNVNDYFAGFSPMQKQAQLAAASMPMPGQYKTATGIANIAGLGSLNAADNYNRMATDPTAMSAFMSPYQQKVVDFQKKQAIDDYARTLPGQQAAAANAGAFGGSRQAIVEGENRRNLQNTLAGIQATGTQNAFQNAQQAQQFGANLGMTGYNQGLQGASTLANIGGQELGAQQGIANAQNTMGAQQQALEQSKINQGIQNYATQQQYPMMQLGLMSNMLRGLPMQSTSAQTYQAAPTAASQLVGSAGALGSLYQGMTKTNKEGGVIRGLAGGGPVNGVSGEIKQQLSMMSEEQLTQVMNTSTSREVRAMAAEILAGKRIAEQMTSQMPSSPGAGQGIAAADTGDMFTNMADGGIIAFAGGSEKAVAPEENYYYNPLTKRNELIEGKTETPMSEETKASLAGLSVAKRPNMQPGAGASIEDYAKYLGAVRTDAGIGAPRQAEEEMLYRRMAGRPAEESSQNYFKAAEFFAKMANTPGGLLRSATKAGAEVLPEFAKLQVAQRQVRETDAKIQADITEAARLEKVGLFDQAAKLRSEAEKLQGENERNRADIAARLNVANVQAASQREVAGIQGANQQEAERIRGGFNVQAAGMRGGAEKRDAEVFEAYIKDITAKNDKLSPGQKLSPEQVRVAAYQQMQKDRGGGGDRLDATLAAAASRTYTALLKGNKFEIGTLERDIKDAKTPAIKDEKTKELKDLKAGLLDEARRIAYNEDAPRAPAPAPAPAPAAAPTTAPAGQTGVDFGNLLLNPPR